jgi:hypothetical protein
MARYIIELEDLDGHRPGAPPVGRRLAALLKTALRRDGFRCRSTIEKPTTLNQSSTDENCIHTDRNAGDHFPR